MDFRTVVDISGSYPQISHADEMLLMGSCFAEHIGQYLVGSKFHCDVNPYGILYNPRSIQVALREIMEKKRYTEEDLFFYQERYRSFMHHGQFASGTSDEALARINTRIERAHEAIPRMKYLLLTFGAAWVFTRKEDGRVVSNCHKVPADRFELSRLRVGDIVSGYESLIRDWLRVSPDCKVIFTVSPIRHAKHGAHGNQLSKATLLLAVDELQERFPEHAFYFPSYEILLDELRDYRFYADDMNHPSPLAVNYIRKRFAETFFSSETQNIIKECENIRKDLLHRPVNKDSDGYKRFLDQIVLKINRLSEKYPNLDVENERKQCLTLLNQ